MEYLIMFLENTDVYIWLLILLSIAAPYTALFFCLRDNRKKEEELNLLRANTLRGRADRRKVSQELRKKILKK